MALSRAAFLLLMLTLAGCYRPAGENFDPVEGQNAIPAVTTQEVLDPSPTVLLIQPQATDITPAQTAEAVETEIPPVVPFDNPTETPLPEVTLIQPAVDTPTQDTAVQQPVPLATFTTAPLSQPQATNTPPPPPPLPSVPTATTIGSQIITPGAPSAVEFPTFTLSPTTQQANDAVQPTPTAPGESVLSGECTYTVRSGDNLFRIALTNNVELEDLRAANNLANDLIQPGDVLILPGCIAAETTESPAVSATQEIAAPSGTLIHTVAAGETLSTIARQYGVTVRQIVDANTLPDPNVLSIGQQIIIPSP